MTDIFENNPTTKEHRPNSSREALKWGVRLFLGTLFAVLAFFWWLLIYSGGVGGHHG